MGLIQYVCWKSDPFWLGYLEEYPEYWTQGENLEDLRIHLESLYEDLTSGEIPGIRKIVQAED